MQNTLLLVDDEINILRALERLFENEGYEILIATSGVEALKILSEYPVQVIISDQRMPEMTGAEFFKQVKKLYPHTIRIILSAHADFDAVTEAINEGSIFKFFNKPWDGELLKQVVSEAFLQHAQLYDKEQQYLSLLKKNKILLQNNHNGSDEVPESELEAALANKQFTIRYQPILDTHSLDIVGAEALVRLQHPQRGLLEPSSFISSCEHTGLIIPLGAYILRAACQQLKMWHDDGFNKLIISVNISARQFNDPGLFDLVTQVLDETGVAPQFLYLEITETLAIQNLKTTTMLFHLLKKLGVNIVLDDFGTGYSSLQYLKDLPIGVLKIDKSFVQNMATDVVSDDIIDTISHLAKNLNLELIAEGVEDSEQLLKLQNKECCSYVQGYLFSKPVSSDDFTRLLKKLK